MSKRTHKGQVPFLKVKKKNFFTQKQRKIHTKENDQTKETMWDKTLFLFLKCFFRKNTLKFLDYQVEKLRVLLVLVATLFGASQRKAGQNWKLI